jgi:hypothetical protein
MLETWSVTAPLVGCLKASIGSPLAEKTKRKGYGSLVNSE